MVCDTSSAHVLYVCHIWSDSSKYGWRHGADRAKTWNDQCDIDLTLRPENEALYITPWVGCMPHIEWFGQIRWKPQSVHHKNFKWPVLPWPLTFWPGNGKHFERPVWPWPFDLWMNRDISSHHDYICARYKADQTGTEPMGGHDKNFEWPLWLWPLIFSHETVCATSIR